MFPLRDVIPSRTTPVVTIAFIVVNGLVFLYELALTASDPAALDVFIAHFAFIPADFSVPTMFTSMFLHSGWLHIIGNMMALWVFGDNIEDRLGHGRYFAFYLFCGVFAAVAHGLSNTHSPVPTVGASGAIAGIMGAYFVLYPHSRVLVWAPIFFIFEIPAVVFLGFWFLTQLLSGVGSLLAATGEPVGGIAFWAHIAGFACGALLVRFVARPERQRLEWWDSQV
jgi:membrane associated rhomboid family serine protease